MGSGKTTIGKNLSKKMNIPFIDLDQYIEEKEGLTIVEIFKKFGEVHFRKIEHLYFKELLKYNETFVLSLGGGTPCYANNHLFLQNDDIESFYIKTSIKILVERLKHSENRPLLKNIEDLNTYVAQHLFERLFFYNYAKYTIETNNKSINNICEEILTNI